MSLLLLLACGGDDSAARAAPGEEGSPVAGAYAMTVADAWSGTCDLDDPATYEAATQEWTFDPRGDVLILYRDFWTPLTCTLDGLAFSCDDGSWNGGRMEVTRLVEGTFTASGTVGGQLVVELDCGGAGCDELQETYGRDLTFPCRAEAAFSGAIP